MYCMYANLNQIIFCRGKKHFGSREALLTKRYVTYMYDNTINHVLLKHIGKSTFSGSVSTVPFGFTSR